MSHLVIAPTETIITLTYNEDNPNEFSYEHGVNRKIEGKEGIDAIGKRDGWNVYYKGVLVETLHQNLAPHIKNPQEIIEKYEIIYQQKIQGE